MKLATAAVLMPLPGVLGAATPSVNISSGVTASTTEAGRACWQDKDCATYPYCRQNPKRCRCLSSGTCLLVRDYGQHCSSSTNCADGMQCVVPTASPTPGGTRIKGICRCESGARYSRSLNMCLRVNPSITQEMPRFADLPDPGGEDADAPEEIPATYGGALLVGTLSLSLVVLCLVLTIWCHYTSRHIRKQLMESHKCLYATRRRLEESEKIPLDMFLPPPEMYQTPGFQNYLTISDNMPTTSNTHESLGMLGNELSRTLR
ncbi:hypothetical protein C0J52_12786 [Blattella germanica]|nr:hypothetical protein C0J52_12786 [Blattella germanica]